MEISHAVPIENNAVLLGGNLRVRHCRCRREHPQPHCAPRRLQIICETHSVLITFNRCSSGGPGGPGDTGYWDSRIFWIQNAFFGPKMFSESRTCSHRIVILRFSDKAYFFLYRERIFQFHTCVFRLRNAISSQKTYVLQVI